MRSTPKAETPADESLFRRYRQAKGNSLDLIYQWTKQGIIGNSRQFKQLVAHIIEKEIDQIADELNEEARGELPTERRH